MIEWRNEFIEQSKKQAAEQKREKKHEDLFSYLDF